MKYDSKTQDYQCKYCPDPPYKSNQKINLWTHIRSVHLRDRQFRCDLCSFSASQKINLETHIKSVHLRSRPFKCWECPFAATQQGNLQTHVRIVHFEKGQFKEEDNNTQSNKEKREDAISVVKTEPIDKVEEKLLGTYQDNENEKLGRYKPSGRQKKQKLSSWRNLPLSSIRNQEGDQHGNAHQECAPEDSRKHSPFGKKSVKSK